MGNSNERLRASGAPALLREFTLEADFQARVRLPSGNCTVLLSNVARPNAQMQALTGNGGADVRVSATYIAAPSLVPSPAKGGGLVPCP